MNQNEPERNAELFLEWLKPIQRDLEVYARRMIWDENELYDTLHNALVRAGNCFRAMPGPILFSRLDV